jgi:hypothetical protein
MSKPETSLLTVKPWMSIESSVSMIGKLQAQPFAWSVLGGGGIMGSAQRVLRVAKTKYAQIENKEPEISRRFGRFRLSTGGP